MILAFQYFVKDHLNQQFVNWLNSKDILLLIIQEKLMVHMNNQLGSSRKR
jgi:hypothetical protein